MKLRIKILVTAVSFSVTMVRASAADFTEVPVADLPGLDSSTVAWGDYDNDGRLDFLVTGTTNNTGTGGITQLWRNTGTGFTNVPLPGVQGVVFGNAGWVDYDNDGRLDFLVTGTTNGILTGTILQLWHNTGAGFQDTTAAVLPGLTKVNQSSVLWGDFDNNGTKDLLILGHWSGGRLTQIWRNTGTAFTNATPALAPGLPGLDNGAVAAGDYDNDGWLDLLISGESSTGRVAQVWHNTGTGFTNVTGVVAPQLAGVAYSAAAWGDYDNDGRLDFVLTGESSTGRVAQVWRNLGGQFSNVTAAIAPELLGLRYGSATWVDYDNDGRLDLFVAGNRELDTYSAQVFRNTGTGFASSNQELSGVFSTSAPSSAWGDYDNDGRIDVLITGSSASGGVAKLWHSTVATTNAPAPAPANLACTVSDNEFQFVWSPVNDTESGTNLTYNIRIGTLPSGSDVVGPQADLATGYRRVPALGNVQLGTNATFYLPSGTYYWSVQAVDGALAGGAFSPEQVVTVGSPTLSIMRSGTNVIVSWIPATPGWILQESSGLTASGWTNSATGALNPATFEAKGLTRLFRLHKP